MTNLKWFKQMPSIDGKYWTRLADTDAHGAPVTLKDGKFYSTRCGGLFTDHTDGLMHEWAVRDDEA